ncbi:hypothetical protein HNP93_001003 [Methanococcus maripaludis]|uniref:Uncharacterized protein n=1 Tax=Methanococcus maripaludis TaxID=39152 RepID=A0A7J9P527_METMI|nr:hypothetical protein [Methanococcus maripaludis]MBA2858302.1 hypothetical protein [Methanococcus maripaludis]
MFEKKNPLTPTANESAYAIGAKAAEDVFNKKTLEGLVVDKKIANAIKTDNTAEDLAKANDKILVLEKTVDELKRSGAKTA